MSRLKKVVVLSTLTVSALAAVFLAAAPSTSQAQARAEPKVCLFTWSPAQLAPTIIERTCLPGDTLFVRFMPEDLLLPALYCDMGKQIILRGQNLICIMRSPLGIINVDNSRR